MLQTGRRLTRPRYSLQVYEFRDHVPIYLAARASRRVANYIAVRSSAFYGRINTESFYAPGGIVNNFLITFRPSVWQAKDNC
jgi:hypothetical protein